MELWRDFLNTAMCLFFLWLVVMMVWCFIRYKQHIPDETQPVERDYDNAVGAMLEPMAKANTMGWSLGVGLGLAFLLTVSIRSRRGGGNE